MKWFLMCLTLAASALVSTERAEAVNRGQGSSQGYHQSHGTRFSHGYFYRGREHNHWTYRYYWSRYGCECFYCPSTSCWYYWSEPSYCYYPVSYIRTAPPTPLAPAAAAAAAASSSAVGPTVIAPTIIMGQSGPSAGPIPAPPVDVPPVPVAPSAAVKNVANGGMVRVGPGN